jgi:N,N'-diacetylchitobiose phosphorylase
MSIFGFISICEKEISRTSSAKINFCYPFIVSKGRVAMKFGYFDNENREYVITRPDTPLPWINYLGSPGGYGAIITNNAGGYTFLKNGSTGRILRSRFNMAPDSQPGRFLYIRDRVSRDFWSASWQPVCKDLSKSAYECRHGHGYSTFTSKYSDIETRVHYYIPLSTRGGNCCYEVWAVRVTNTSNRRRSLSVFTYAELSNHDMEKQDMGNLPYSLYISRTYNRPQMILQAINENQS